MHVELYQTVVIAFCALALLSSLIVIFSRSPVHSALALVFTFVATAGIWLLAQAEFLALILVLVYVGAVMTLFLFVVMMTDISASKLKKNLLVAIPLFAIIFSLFFVWAEKYSHQFKLMMPKSELLAVSNTERLGQVLYTKYMLPFELAAVVLLVAIISSIVLAFRGVKKGTIHQRTRAQIMTRKEDRLTMVKMSAQSKNISKSR